MNQISNRIITQISEYKSLCTVLNDIDTKRNISKDKWSINQIIGHLIDSACNNHQRIVRLKQEQEIAFPDYVTDIWINQQKHNGMDFSVLFNLFFNYNMLIAHLINTIEPAQLNNRWNVKWGDYDSMTLDFIASHYAEHLRYHFIHMKERIDELRSEHHVL